jgi:hypothetical protein
MKIFEVTLHRKHYIGDSPIEDDWRLDGNKMFDQRGLLENVTIPKRVQKLTITAHTRRREGMFDAYVGVTGWSTYCLRVSVKNCMGYNSWISFYSSVLDKLIRKHRLRHFRLLFLQIEYD